jgi:hypothetical protein
MDELQKLAEQAGWPLEKQAAFLEDRKKTQWDAEAIDEATMMLKETLATFGMNPADQKPFAPRLYKEPSGDDD